jgi:HEAT repeat protein
VSLGTTIYADLASLSEVETVILKQQGYPTSTVEQITEATKSKSYAIRYAAIHLLTERVGKAAIPVLKEALRDPENVSVRRRAAQLLGTLGDKSGVEQMKKDFAELRAKAALSVPNDPNTSDDARKRIQDEKNAALYDALGVAKVLAELGDLQGYELAATTVFEGTWELHRAEAIRVLAEIAGKDKGVLGRHQMAPLAVLSAAADSEKSAYVFSALLSAVAKLPHKDAISVLDRAGKSANQSEGKRKEAQGVIDLLKAKKKAAEEPIP